MSKTLLAKDIADRDESGILLKDAVIQKDARLDRGNVIFNDLASDQEYLAACVLMNAQLSAGLISRFIIKGMVDAEFDEQKAIPILDSDGGLIEINKLPIDPKRKFLWIARNSKERSLSVENLGRLVSKINNRAMQQSTDKVAFQNEANRLYEIATKKNFRIVCNDPTGDFGKDRIDPQIYTSLMRGYFYKTRSDCVKYLSCYGYSTSWHYLFGLVDQYNNQLGTFMMAKWPWGVEATYTTFQRGIPKNWNCAQILMLFSMALVSDKYKNELVYGEANTWNAGPCIQSGLHALPSALSQNFVTNVETADNAIRLDGALAENVTDLIPPSYKTTPYACYGVHKLHRELFARGIISQAEKLLS